MVSVAANRCVFCCELAISSVIVPALCEKHLALVDMVRLLRQLGRRESLENTFDLLDHVCQGQAPFSREELPALYAQMVNPVPLQEAR